MLLPPPWPSLAAISSSAATSCHCLDPFLVSRATHTVTSLLLGHRCAPARVAGPHLRCCTAMPPCYPASTTTPPSNPALPVPPPSCSSPHLHPLAHRRVHTIPRHACTCSHTCAHARVTTFRLAHTCGAATMPMLAPTPDTLLPFLIATPTPAVH